MNWESAGKRDAEGNEDAVVEDVRDFVRGLVRSIVKNVQLKEFKDNLSPEELETMNDDAVREALAQYRKGIFDRNIYVAKNVIDKIVESEYSTSEEFEG